MTDAYDLTPTLDQADAYFATRPRSDAWRDATGVTPAAGVEYDVTLTLDFKKQTYTVSLKADGGAEVPLVCAGSAEIPFASAGTQVKGILLDGRSELTSIDGSYKAFAGFTVIAR